MELIPAKTIISGYATGSEWFGVNYNMNIYKGCSHGCIYCDSRSDCYRVEDFDRVRAKAAALAIIESELKSKQRKGVVGTGAMSDPYNPEEALHCLTRGALALLDRYDFGVAIATKSDLVVRDIPLLEKIQRHSPTLIKLTITTADDALAAKIEAQAPPPSRRFEALRTLREAGIFAGIILMPVLPFITDSPENIRQIIEQAADCGASFIYPAYGVTLRQNQRDHFLRQLHHHFPQQEAAYLRQFGNAYQCPSPRAAELDVCLKAACTAHGILCQMPDIIDAYTQPYRYLQPPLF